MRAQSEVAVLAMVPWEHLAEASALLIEVLLAWMTLLRSSYCRDHGGPVEQCLSQRGLGSIAHNSDPAGSDDCGLTHEDEMEALDKMSPCCAHSSGDPTPEADHCLGRAAEVALPHCRSYDHADRRDHDSRKLQWGCACHPF